MQLNDTKTQINFNLKKIFNICSLTKWSTKGFCLFRHIIDSQALNDPDFLANLRDHLEIVVDLDPQKLDNRL